MATKIDRDQLLEALKERLYFDVDTDNYADRNIFTGEPISRTTISLKWRTHPHEDRADLDQTICTETI